MPKKKPTPAVKTIEDAKTECRNPKDGKQKYVAVEQWLKKFKKWYAPSGNEYTVTLPAIEIYSYISGLNEQGKQCYANQDTLAEVGMVKPRQVRNIIRMFEDLGVVHVEERKGQTSIYTALPFTDAHVIPPDQLPAAPIIVSDKVPHQPAQMPVPEPEKAAEEKSDDNVPDWFNSKDDVKPTPPMNRMNAACEFLIQNIDIQAETESFTQFTERVCRNNRKIRLPQGIEDYFKNTHPELYNFFDPIPF
ncbi:hypothetical protein ACJEQI_10375 [Klebsiella variicola]|uniref:hypothetical protein n=1 Tax=Klebsiella variicola TaxID=244366 RepID=UPI001BA2EB2D|nr:hypothetical protein [Citrobacter koseri]